DTSSWSIGVSISTRGCFCATGTPACGYRNPYRPRRGIMTQTSTPSTISVVIVDDHEIFRTGLRSSLGDGLRVDGEAATVDEAINLIADTQPDVVLLDVHLPGGDGGGGAEVARTITRRPG